VILNLDMDIETTVDAPLMCAFFTFCTLPPLPRSSGNAYRDTTSPATLRQAGYLRQSARRRDAVELSRILQTHRASAGAIRE
jgi:hypothetical protein